MSSHAARADWRYAVALVGLPGNSALGGKHVRDHVINSVFLTAARLRIWVQVQPVSCTLLSLPLCGWLIVGFHLLFSDVNVAPTKPRTAWIIMVLCIVEASVKLVYLCWRDEDHALYSEKPLIKLSNWELLVFKWPNQAWRHNLPPVTYFSRCLIDISNLRESLQARCTSAVDR